MVGLDAGTAVSSDGSRLDGGQACGGCGGGPRGGDPPQKTRMETPPQTLRIQCVQTNKEKKDLINESNHHTPTTAGNIKKTKQSMLMACTLNTISISSPSCEIKCVFICFVCSQIHHSDERLVFLESA